MLDRGRETEPLEIVRPSRLLRTTPCDWAIRSSTIYLGTFTHWAGICTNLRALRKGLLWAGFASGGSDLHHDQKLAEMDKCKLLS